MSATWSWYVIALLALNILGIAWLLWWTARRRPGDPKPEDTSHYWDEDITEYNKPMPRWWINGFYLAIAFGIGYLFWYGGLGTYQGYSQWSSAREHERDKAARNATLAETFRAYDGAPIPQLAADPAARALGQSIFANTCATCHGSSAQGAIGYPNLADDIWHWGGEPERILQTVMDGREGVMPEWGKVLTGIGGDNAVDYVIAYVRTLAAPGKSLQNDYLASTGKKLYDGVCVACHGVDGKGNTELGAPDLTDDYWLHGSSTASLRETIVNGRHGVMPAHAELLGETRARLVAAYVWSLSNRPAPAGSASAANSEPAR
ncbi:cytochrome-c oxidase, cbb3-type subunit III [Lysobacter koreensis]|uniref:Cbb3-type cytochrome c oxidase subunit n=1 Tax=Lysobacter koreensis TaxID=266122 RepID=A0ABW2YHZ3_9GAMM